LGTCSTGTSPGSFLATLSFRKEKVKRRKQQKKAEGQPLLGDCFLFVLTFSFQKERVARNEPGEVPGTLLT